MYSLLRKYTFLTRCQAIVNLTERHIDSFSNVWTIKGFCSRNDTHYNFEDRIEVKPTSKLLLETTGMHIHITNLLTLGWHVNVGIDNPVQDPQSLSSPLTTKVSNAGLLIHKEEDGKVIHIVNKKRLSDIASQVPTLRVQVPVSLDLCVNAFDCGNVTLQNLTVRNLSCCTRNGDVTSENLKCENFNVISTNGNVICRGPVLGNVHVSVSGNGHISVDRLQGMDICLQADSGNIKAEALYAEKSFVSSVNANVTLANLHGNSTVNVGRGNLHLAGVNGDLTANVAQGDADIHISKLSPTSHMMIVCSTGDARLALLDNLVARLKLEGIDVVVDESIRGSRITESLSNIVIYEGHLNGGQIERAPLIAARTPMGKVVVKTQSWFSSLNIINKKHPEYPMT